MSEQRSVNIIAINGSDPRQILGAGTMEPALNKNLDHNLLQVRRLSMGILDASGSTKVLSCAAHTSKASSSHDVGFVCFDDSGRLHRGQFNVRTLHGSICEDETLGDLERGGGAVAVNAYNLPHDGDKYAQNVTISTCLEIINDIGTPGPQRMQRFLDQVATLSDDLLMRRFVPCAMAIFMSDAKSGKITNLVSYDYTDIALQIRPTRTN